jgi:hypothetical protein
VIKEHAAAVLALLDADNAVPPLVVYDGVVPSDTDPSLTPYVLVRFSELSPELNFRGVTHTFALRITCHCVGGTDSAVRTVADRVRTALLDVTPTVSGRVCYPIRWEESAARPVQERTGMDVASMILGYVLRSVPA